MAERQHTGNRVTSPKIARRQREPAILVASTVPATLPTTRSGPRKPAGKVAGPAMAEPARTTRRLQARTRAKHPTTQATLPKIARRHRRPGRKVVTHRIVLDWRHGKRNLARRVMGAA